jgi:hypothetical protein
VILLYGSFGLAALNLTVQLLIARKKAYGWLVALGAQIPWTAYDIATRQYGWLILSVVYVPVYIHGWRQFRAGEAR